MTMTTQPALIQAEIQTLIMEDLKGDKFMPASDELVKYFMERLDIDIEIPEGYQGRDDEDYYRWSIALGIDDMGIAESFVYDHNLCGDDD